MTDWLFQYTGNCDVAIREAYKQGQLLLWVCYQNWVLVVMVIGIFIAFFLGLLIEILRHKEEKPTRKLKVRVD